MPISHSRNGPLSTRIRQAARSDADEIAKLHVSAWQSAYRGQMPDSHLDGLDVAKRAALWSMALERTDTLVLVASIREACLGFCSFLPSRDADASAAVGEIAAIYVDPSAWRAGVGSSLIDAMCDAALVRGFSEVTLWVLTSNVPARSFYEARGFQTDGHTKIEERPGFSVQEIRYRRRIAA